MKMKHCLSLLIGMCMLSSSVTVLATENKRLESHSSSLHPVILEKNSQLSHTPVSSLIYGITPAQTDPLGENILESQEESQWVLPSDLYSREKRNELEQFTVAQATTAGEFYHLEAYDTFEQARASMQERAAKAPNELTKNSYVVCNAEGRVLAMINGMAVALSPGNSILVFQNTHGGRNPYVSLRTTMYYNESLHLDELYVSVSALERAKTAYHEVQLIPAPFMSNFSNDQWQQTNLYERDYYAKNQNGELVHYVTRLLNNPDSYQFFEPGEGTIKESFILDVAPNFMQEGVRYYSMDGVTFFTDPFLSNESAVGEFYPYFKHLPYRSRTSYTKSEINHYLHENMPEHSVMKNANLGDYFIHAQDTYNDSWGSGVNALLEMSFAIHESGRGTSTLSNPPYNNLFGIRAYDSDPTQAQRFPSLEENIRQHTRIWLKEGYFNALGDARYFGSNSGNKKTGINVAYASDPYHGEKIAGWAYRIDKLMGGKDYGRYSIGLSTTSAPVWADPFLQLLPLYHLKNNYSNSDLTGLPVVLLKTQGFMHQIQSDLAFPLYTNHADAFLNYSLDHHMAYIFSENIEKIW